jgi:hypothetical protein
MKTPYILLISLLALLQTGCATYENSKPMPLQGEKISFEVSGEDISSWNDVIVGAYVVPDSHVVISGHQTGGGVGAIFGLVGVLIENAAGKAGGKRSVATLEEKLGFKLNKIVEDKLENSIKEGSFSTLFSVNDVLPQHVLTIKPMLVLTHTYDNKKIRPFTILQTTLRSKDSEEKVWSSRYISSLGDNRLLSGEDGWLEHDKLALNKFLDKNLNASIQLMLKDLKSPYDRKNNDKIVVEGNVPFLKDVYQLLGQKLTESDDALVYIAKQPDVSTISGVIIADKKHVAYRLATKKDPQYKRIKSNEEKEANAEIKENCESPEC